ncbi:hypothetical protein ACJMK2_041585 [Sinanodonta woodiana]|uniref:Chitin-binding type-2 domain-containing protein n=1 Tax=Sinanodonta woodiana TaxID=1069815 RepID=A0ABD3W7Y8_SINWO
MLMHVNFLICIHSITVTKPSPCTSGELLPKKDNCSFYFLCGYNNELQEKQCETGKVFSPARKQCVQKYSLQDDCSQVTKPSACTVGELLPKKDNCSSYLLCGYNNELQEKQCEAGKAFSPTRKQCVQKYSHQDDCSQGTKSSPCTSGELLPKKDNCSFFFLCVYNNELHEKQCEMGKVFSPTRKQCVLKYSLQDDCSQGTKPSSCSQGELLPKKDNCSSYFLCDYNYELQEKQCETGKVFSPARKQCVQKYGVQDDCSQVTKPSPCTFGEFLPKKDNCSFYFLCGYNNELQEKQCEAGKVFSPARKQCVQKYSLQDDCSQGTKPVPCTYGELLPKKDNCSSYFLCGYNNELQEKRCEMGKVFSPTRKQCVQKYGLQDDCSQVIKPIPCIPGEFLPKKDNCNSYFLCGYDYKLQEKQCMPGKVFSPTRKQCVQKNGLQDDCSQVTKPSPCTPDTLLPMKNDCSSYFFCDYNYELQEKQCETGKVFSPTRKQCVQKYSIQDDCSPG